MQHIEICEIRPVWFHVSTHTFWIVEWTLGYIFSINNSDIHICRTYVQTHKQDRQGSRSMDQSWFRKTLDVNEKKKSLCSAYQLLNSDNNSHLKWDCLHLQTGWRTLSRCLSAVQTVLTQTLTIWAVLFLALTHTNRFHINEKVRRPSMNDSFMLNEIL